MPLYYREEARNKKKLDLKPHLSSMLFGDTIVPNIESGYILLFGYSISYKEYNLTVFNHPKKRYSPTPWRMRVSRPAFATFGLTLQQPDSWVPEIRG